MPPLLEKWPPCSYPSGVFARTSVTVYTGYSVAMCVTFKHPETLSKIGTLGHDNSRL